MGIVMKKSFGQLWSANHIKSNTISVVTELMSDGLALHVNGILLPINWEEYGEEDVLGHEYVRIDDKNKDWLPMFNSTEDADRVFVTLGRLLGAEEGSFGLVFDRISNLVSIYGNYPYGKGVTSKYSTWLSPIGDFLSLRVDLYKRLRSLTQPMRSVSRLLSVGIVSFMGQRVSLRRVGMSLRLV